MAAYLVISVLTGLVFALTHFFAFDGGFGMSVVWYLIGCWSGFCVTLALVLATFVIRKPAKTKARAAFG